ncbi:zinc finger family protein [Salix suchowensis]|nr:zinc finger family protein [Salix suchowensis]
MVVCKCRKATKLYCFVHKVPVCGDCICFPEHQICVVRTYSEWVIDGEYDWPPRCCSCQAVFQEGDGPQTTRLGCLHVIHTNCLVSHTKSFPPHTAPAGYVCPSCSTPIWPPKSVKDSGSRLHLKLKEAIMQTGLEKNLFGNHPFSLPSPPPAFTSDPLVAISSSPSVTNETGTGPSKISVSDIIEIDSPGSVSNYMKNSSTGIPVATTRKVGAQVERQNSELSYFADDEDGNRKKYSRRGPFRHKFLRALLPFWSSALPTLPVTAPPSKDAANADDASEGRTRHKKHSRMDPRKILLIIAIMACMTTMGILYYRIAQRGLGEEQPSDEQQ